MVLKNIIVGMLSLAQNVELMMMMMMMVESDRISKTEIIWQIPRVSVFVDQTILGIYSEDKFLIRIMVSPCTFK